MAYGLSYMPNFSNAGAGFKAAGDAIGKYFDQRGEQKGQANKLRSYLGARMPDRKEEFDQMGLRELEAADIAYKAEEVDQSRNLLNRIATAQHRFKQEQEASIFAAENPDLSGLKAEKLRLQEIMGQANDPNLPKEQAQLSAMQKTITDRFPVSQEHTNNVMRLEAIDRGLVQAPAQERASIAKNIEAYNLQMQSDPGFQKSMEDFRRNQLRLNEISGLMDQAKSGELANQIRDIDMQMVAEKRRGMEAAEAIRNQPLDLGPILSGAFAENPLASPAAIGQAVQLAGVLQNQRFAEEMQPARKQAAEAGARRATIDADIAEATQEEAEEIFKTNLTKLQNEVSIQQGVRKNEKLKHKALKKKFGKEVMDLIEQGDLSKALEGKTGPEADRILDAFKTKISLDNSETQALYAQLQKSSDEPGLSSSKRTAISSLANSAARRLATMEQNLLQSQSLTAYLPDSERKKQLIEFENNMKTQIEVLKKEKEKYQGLIDKDLGLGDSTNASQSLPPDGTIVEQGGKRYRVQGGQYILIN